MQNYRECFEKVRKDCVKYIQSQETKKEAERKSKADSWRDGRP